MDTRDFEDSEPQGLPSHIRVAMWLLGAILLVVGLAALPKISVCMSEAGSGSGGKCATQLLLGVSER